ncbi:MAG: hypothetical protein P4L92_17505 [Rudaea sp.]|nr:hypothetical protein [Rudaea sp.]
MKRTMKVMILATVLALPLISSGCVYIPPRAHYGTVWVPGHWGGPYGNAWVGGHWR